MADYDAPVCAPCDRRHENVVAILDIAAGWPHPQPAQPVDDQPGTPVNTALHDLAAAVTVETYGRLVPEYRNPKTAPAAAQLDALRELDGPVLHVIDGGAA